MANMVPILRPDKLLGREAYGFHPPYRTELNIPEQVINLLRQKVEVNYD